ncbi:hypothetical protein ScPMuIL_010486 [Solemya velum]
MLHLISTYYGHALEGLLLCESAAVLPDHRLMLSVATLICHVHLVSVQIVHYTLDSLTHGMGIFAVLLSVSAALYVCHGQCFHSGIRTSITASGQTEKYCMHDGIRLDTGSKIVKDCLSCSCSDSGLGCCSTRTTVVNLPDNCKTITEGCTSRAVMKSDEGLACDGHVSMVG